MAVNRLDHGTLRLDAKNRTSQGFLRCDAVIARTGIQLYSQPDGKVRREYRPPDEVFHADALASAEQAPITFTPTTPNMHPPEPVTADNADQYTVGWTGAEAKKDGHLVVTSATVFDAKAIAAAQSGEASGISCGYSCELEHKPGVTPEGEHYDAIQRNIRINHIAMVRPDIARAGPEARFRLDANDNAVQETPALPQGEKAMALKIIRIDGVECEVSETAAQLLAKLDAERTEKKKKREDEAAVQEKQHADALAAKDKALSDAKTELEKQKARADAAETAKAAAEKARADAEDPTKMQARIAARVELETTAKAILGGDTKLDGKSDAEVKKLVAAKAFEALKLDGKSDAYVEALFDQASADYRAKHPMDDVRRSAGGGGDAGKRADADQELTAEAAHAEMIKANRELALPQAAKK